MDGDGLLVFDVASEEPGRDATRFRRDETIGGGVRRICVRRLGRAAAVLTAPGVDRDSAVHSARKSMKRVRGIIRLVRDQVGRRVYREENVVVRDTARILAPVRDGAVMLQVLDRVVERFELDAADFAATRHWLEARHREARTGVLNDRTALAHVVTSLRACRLRFARWPVDETGHPMAVPDRFDSIALGLQRVYRRGRQAAVRGAVEPSTAVLHEWRKRVKYLRYQMEALTPIWPAVVGTAATELDHLGETLGEEHDMAVFERTLERDGRIPGNERDLLLVLAHAERARLQAEARPLGARLYAEKPAAFVARIGSYWDAWREGPDENAAETIIDEGARYPDGALI
jgi:CHAD domain-containing protein